MFKIPFIGLCISFITGIFLSHSIPVSYPPTTVFAVLILCFLLLICLNVSKMGHQIGFGIMVILIFFLLGIERSRIKTKFLESSPLFQISNYHAEFLVQVSDHPEFDNWIQVQAKLLYFKDTTGLWRKSHEAVIIYLESEPEVRNLLLVGDNLYCRGTLQEIQTRSNPFSFDYRQYMYRQSIQFQSFVNSENWELIKQAPETRSLQIKSLQLRANFLGILEKYIPSKAENALVSAILLGYKNEISEELYTIFKTTGVIHVLAVSGLHVGIVSLLIFSILKRIKIQSGIWLKCRSLITLLCIWSYAYVTGLSPSVLRASTMFSLIYLSQMTKRKSNIYNIIAVSAFVILWTDPFLLFQLGFQFSYLAVTGIIFFYPILINILSPPNILINFIWKSIVVSVSAQLLISPLSLFYFHQFPSYFWLSSIFAVPAAALILILGIAVISLHFLFPPLASLTGIVLQKFIQLFIWLLEGIENIPFALVTGVYFDGVSVILSFLVIFGIMIFVINKNPAWICLVLLCILVFPLKDFYKFHQQQTTHEVFIYDHRKAFLADFVVNQTVYVLASTGYPKLTFDRMAGNNRIHKQVRHEIRLSGLNHFADDHLVKSDDLIEFGSHLFYIPRQLKPAVLSSADYVFITGQTEFNKNISFENYTCTYVIHPSAKQWWQRTLPENQSVDMNMTGYFSIKYP